MLPHNKFIREIITHISIWICVYGILLIQFYYDFGRIPIDFLATLLLNVVLFYVNFSLLVPKLLLKKRLGIYILVSIILIVVAVVISHKFLMPQLPFERIKGGMPPKIDMEQGPKFGFLPGLLPFVTFSFYFLLGSILRIYVEWKKNDTLRKKVENEKINSELQFLKTQLNPHFLFNSLNAIYSLSIKKSPDTSEAIINLSELMRYMLYEANRDFVPLTKEVIYIQNYIQLQRLRLSNSEEVTINVYGEEKDRLIPPLLFISFIENAFMYGTDYEGKTHVKINLTFTDTSIRLFVQNKIGHFKKELKNSGVGLQNIKNRLQLLYPDSHTLKAGNDGAYYIVDLTLNSGENEVHHNRR